jgi:autotransporter-associated beta strand protein
MSTNRPVDRRRKPVVAVLFAAAAACGLAGTSDAAQYTWTGGGGSLNTGWNVNGNWAGGVKPVAADDAVVVFGAGAGDNFQDISIPLTIHELQFAPGSSDHVGGFPLDLRGNATQQTGFIHTLTDQTSTISNNLTLSSYLYVIGNSGSGPVILNGNISGANTIGAANRGVLRLAGNNTFSGGIDLSYGDELQVTNSASLGTGTLWMDAGTSIRAFGAPVTLPNAYTFYNVGTYSFVGDKDITFNGPGTITNGGPKEFDVAAGITARFNGVISGNNALQVPLNKTGAGTMMLAGNNTFAGSFTVAAGTLAIGGQDALPQNIDLTVNSGAALNLGTFGNGNSSAPSKPINSLTLNGGLLRVPNSSADLWLNQLSMTGGNVDMTGSTLFWMHFNGATPKLTTTASNQTATIGGGICEIRNNSADDLVFNVNSGFTASGIDLDVDAQLVSLGGKFHKMGGGTMRLTGTGNSGKLLIDGGTFRFDDPNVLTFSTLDVLGGGALQYGGTGSVASSQQLHVNVGWIDVPNAQATANFTSGITGNGVVYKSGAGTLALPNARQAFLKVYDGNVRINPNGANTGTSKIGSLWLLPGTRLDLTDNDLVTSSTNSYYTYNDLVGVIKSAYANGSWTGEGITSSSAAASNGKCALGIAKATDLFNSFPATFSGQSVASTDVLIKYTWNGDTDLNGVVNFDDYVRTDNGFNNHLSGWTNGDFNYDGSVNFDDYVLIDLAFNAQSGTLKRALSFLDGSDTSSQGMDTPALQMVREHSQEFGGAFGQAFIIAVPEPQILSILLLSGLPQVLGRRRRGH